MRVGIVFLHVGFCCAALVAACIAMPSAIAQQEPQHAPASDATARAKPDRDKDKLNRLSPYFRSWLNEDAVYIISPEERRSFLNLESDRDRFEFIDAFWQRRNPIEGSNENTFEAEHYRRIVYANEHFGDQTPGLRSDRGRVYIMFGPPDSITAVPAGLNCDGDEGSTIGTVHNAPAHQTWRYRSIEGIGEDVSYDFVERKAPGQGEAANPEFRYVLSVSPCSVDDEARFGMPQELMHKLLNNSNLNQPPRTILEVRPIKTASPENRDLEAAVVSRIVRTQIPIRTSFSSVRATKFTSVVTIKFWVPSTWLLSASTGGAKLELYGRVTNTEDGWIESWFECSTSPADRATDSDHADRIDVCEKTVNLRAGEHELGVAAKAADAKIYGTAATVISVPMTQGAAPAQTLN